jgi:PIN domain nuclease of toxin-antitoxin system
LHKILHAEIENILKLEELAKHHKDPFDRVIIAWALAEPKTYNI